MKTLKFILKVLLVFLAAFIVWILIPRTWSALNPQKPPLGYHFMVPLRVALLTGLEKIVNTSPEVPDNIEAFTDLEYGKAGGKSLQLDIYRPKDSSEALPLLVFIHGGGWQGGKRSDYLVYLIHFARKGYATATISYRLVDDDPYPACAVDVKDAVGWLFSNGEQYGYDSNRIALIGGSAGGHLAMLGAYGWDNGSNSNDTSMTSLPVKKVKAVVDLYGPSDLTTEYARKHPLVTALIARSWDDSPMLYREASPISYLSSDDPPTLIFHGTSDMLVPVIQSDDLKARLDSLGVPCEYYRLPLWPHSMDMDERVNIFCRDRMEEFFRKYLL